MTEASFERFTHGRPVGVDVGAIERDLAALWRMASASDTAVTRACSWNLVVHATTDEALARGRTLADALVAEVPSRTLVLNHRPSGPGPEVEAFVTANCRKLPGGARLVCAEEITVEARGRGADHLPSLVRALLVPDIPTAVLWSGFPPMVDIVPQLIAGVDRLVLDSTGASALRPLARLAGERPVPIADLSWLALAPTRLAIAAAFDPPGDPSMLRRLTKVELESSPGARNAGALLLGWLAASLGWAPPRAGAEDGWRAESPSGPLTVRWATSSGSTARLALTLRGRGAERVAIEVSNGVAHLERPFGLTITPIAQRSDAALVVAALGSRGNDPLYPQALLWAQELER